MNELTFETAQAGIAEAWGMWLAKKHFSGFAIVVGIEGEDAEEEIEISYRLRGKSHEFAFPPDHCLPRRRLRELKQWWEEEARGSTLLPVQKTAPGVFAAKAYFRTPKTGAIFTFDVPIQSR